MKRQCKTCKWRGGRKNPGYCLHPDTGMATTFLAQSVQMRASQNYARSEGEPCGPDGKLWERSVSGKGAA